MKRDRKHRSPVNLGPMCRWDGGNRSMPPDLIVIHTAESPWDAADGVAGYGARTDRKVSWHVVVDNKKAIVQLADWKVAWTAPPVNTESLNIEICGRASASKLQWYTHQANLKRAAWVCARWAHRRRIPARWLTDRELRLGHRGFTTHAQVSRVFKESDHYDPGKGFPSTYFLSLVRRRLKWIESGE